MNRTIIDVTLKQISGKRRSLLMAAFGLVPVLIAVIYRLSNDGETRPAEFTSGLLEVLVVGAVMPLIALVLATSALGSEIEDGTAVYLLAKPIPRPVIVLSKLVVAAGMTAVLVGISALLTGVIGMGGFDSTNVVLAFTVATIIGSIVYCSVFVLLSVMTSRALIVGLIYVFLWEGVVTNIFSGTRLFSISSYTLGIADAITTVSPRDFEANLSGPVAVGAAIVVTLAAVWYAGQRLKRFEIGETS